MKVKIQIVHRTGRVTDLIAIERPKEYEKINIFKVGKGHYVNVPMDSIETITLEVIEGGD